MRYASIPLIECASHAVWKILGCVCLCVCVSVCACARRRRVNIIFSLQGIRYTFSDTWWSNRQWTQEHCQSGSTTSSGDGFNHTTAIHPNRTAQFVWRERKDLMSNDLTVSKTDISLLLNIT